MDMQRTKAKSTVQCLQRTERYGIVQLKNRNVLNKNQENKIKHNGSSTSNVSRKSGCRERTRRFLIQMSPKPQENGRSVFLREEENEKQGQTKSKSKTKGRTS